MDVMGAGAAVRVACALAAVSAMAACEGGPDCSEDRCAAAASRDEVLAALRDHADPVAAYLRDAVTAHGTLEGDYRDILDGVGGVTGCDGDTESTFVVLSSVGLAPRPVHARCANDPLEASQFLMVMAGVTDRPDVDPQVIHMVGWDPDAGQYRRYATYPDGRGEMALNVSPAFCLGCHGGPEGLSYWQPLMNVMTNPWSGWNAEPGFRSHMFDDRLADEFRDGPVFSEMTARLDSAANLEPIVRAGIDRVTSARIRTRDDAADVDAALELLRPVFCDEMVNFVSEVHGGGDLRESALIDDAIRSLLLRVSPDWSWSWLGSTSIHLGEAGGGEPTLDLYPVRGESNVQLELSLASRGVLRAHDLLRARAVDWTRPAGSDYRCDLYRRGRERIAGRTWDPAEMTNAELIPLLFEEIMSELPVDAGADVIAIADGARPDQRVAMTFEQLGDAIEEHVAATASAGRAALDERRRQTACSAAARYPFAPVLAFLPDLGCN